VVVSIEPHALHFAAPSLVVRRRTVRRFIILLFAAFGAVAGTASAQARDSVKSVPSSHAISFGYFATLGSNWQIEAAEVGYVHRLAHGFAAYSIGTRLGMFVDESTVLGGSRGLVFATTVSTRTRMRQIAQLGEDEHGTAIGLDVTLEASGYVASRSPFWQGSHWAGISLLPSLRIGGGAITVGPTLFLGARKPAMRGMLAFRGEATLARRERHP
jgi:hypothetical protein